MTAAGNAERLATVLDRLGARQLESLVGYLRRHGQWAAAARSLGVHWNTLRHRITKCEERLEDDVDDPDTSAELWLLLRRRALAWSRSPVGVAASGHVECVRRVVPESASERRVAGYRPQRASFDRLK
ncbi:PucR-like helix-turn-helix protein [Kribbella sp. VKM Ac-2527]|uniref:PucR-like helix-turn-helix protein n=1 Tax=Kribbella caucasensis TaxID=2512215 RepID=A0A4R6KC40_9ACTN|nr:PucR-like helix-turn-helix protein [Kribbella sp. VKM Ac-2527]